MTLKVSEHFRQISGAKGGSDVITMYFGSVLIIEIYFKELKSPCTSIFLA